MKVELNKKELQTLRTALSCFIENEGDTKDYTELFDKLTEFGIIAYHISKEVVEIVKKECSKNYKNIEVIKDGDWYNLIGELR